MKKNKLIALGAAAVLSATALIGGTLAYFTDTDTETNEFTVGNIDIDLHEANKDGLMDEQYQEWLKDQKLFPTNREQEQIAKIVTIENTSTSTEAYLWAEVWIPQALDAETDDDRSLHLVDGEDVKVEKFEEGRNIDGTLYNGYIYYFDGMFEKNTSTDPLLTAVYMDSRVAQGSENGSYVLADGETEYSGSWELIINAVGIQAEGFENHEEARNAYYGKTVN